MLCLSRTASCPVFYRRASQRFIIHSVSLNFIVRNRRKVAPVHEQYLCRQVLFCSLRRLRIASLSARRTFNRTMKTSVRAFLSALDSPAIARAKLPKTIRRKIHCGSIARKQNAHRASNQTITKNENADRLILFHRINAYF